MPQVLRCLRSCFQGVLEKLLTGCGVPSGKVKASLHMYCTCELMHHAITFYLGVLVRGHRFAGIV